MSGDLASLVSRLETVTTRLESVAASGGGGTTPPAAGKCPPPNTPHTHTLMVISLTVIQVLLNQWKLLMWYVDLQPLMMLPYKAMFWQ